MRRERIRAAEFPDESVADVGHGIRLAYQCFGDPRDPPVVLIMGLGGPMTWWPVSLCQALAAQGLLVVRFDNRDVGRSSRVDSSVHGRADVLRAWYRVPGFRPAYTLDDMAGDVVGLLDHLGVSRAHVVGVSMGGMIAQCVAITHPDRVSSLVSLMSTTGSRRVGWTDPRLVPALFAGGGGEADYVQSAVRLGRRLGTVAYRWDDQALERRARETWSRGRVGRRALVRQLVAVLHAPDRTRSLRTLRLPTTVIHGTADPMIHVSGGRATARAVPGASMMLVPNLGHDLAPALERPLVAAICQTVRRAGRS